MNTGGKSSIICPSNAVISAANCIAGKAIKFTHPTGDTRASAMVDARIFLKKEKAKN